MTWQLFLFGISVLFIIQIFIGYTFFNDRFDSKFSKHYPQFTSKYKNIDKKHICVLIAIKQPLVYHAISSLENSFNMSYQYTLMFGHDHDDFDIEHILNEKIKNYSYDYNILSVYNPLKKPGPVFNALSKHAYDFGCDYMYRINDDTEIIGNKWSARFIQTLAAFDPSNVGVVGPTCHEGNNQILTHDFVHRKHLEIFGVHYPVNLTDWWLDDWITHVYGPQRTKQLLDIVVRHHMQNTKYSVTYSNIDLWPTFVSDSKAILEKYLKNNNDDFLSNVLYKNNQPINLKNLSSPVFITFINEGFKPMAANFICNLQHVMPQVIVDHLIVITESKTTAKWILEYNSNIAFFFYESKEQISSKESWFGSNDYKNIMMMRGYALLHFLGQGVPIIWLEPDAIYYDDLLTVEEIINPVTDFVFYNDNFMPCGCFIVFPKDEKSVFFYKRVLEEAEKIHNKNDQVSLDSIKDNVSWSMLNKCKFRSGAYIVDERADGQKRLTDCDSVKAIVQHLNFVIGLEEKIKLAKRQNAWFVDSNLQCKTREIKTIILTMDRDKSLKRLVESLKNSEAKEIDLHFSVDVSQKNKRKDEIIFYINEIKNTWTKGFVTSKVWTEHAGILKNWVEAWPAELYTENQYGAVILLEDDLEVSPVFHQWFIGAHQVYGNIKKNNKKIGAITGQRPQLIADVDHIHEKIDDRIPKNVKAFAYLLMATWSLSPKVKIWANFRKWYKTLPSDFVPIVPGVNIVMNNWYKQFLQEGKETSMWEMYYIYYSVMIDKHYTLYAWENNGSKTFVCNWREKGLHFDGSQNSMSDYPLVISFNNDILKIKTLPFVDWDVKFN